MVAQIFGRSFRVGLIQLGHITSDKAANLKRAQSLIDRCILESSRDGKEKVDLVVLPEIFNSPYATSSFPIHAEPIPTPSSQIPKNSPTLDLLSKAAEKHGVYLVGGSIPEVDGKNIYNTATVWDPKGQMIAKHRKVHLFDIDIPGGITFKESETLSAGEEVTTFETPFGRIGLAICYDVRFPELAMIAARKGCSTMIYPGAFNMTTGPLHWELLARARAVDNQIYSILCSVARNESPKEGDYIAWGHSMVVDPYGKVVTEADEKECIIYADIDYETINKIRTGIPVTSQRRFEVYKDVAEGA
ncbi:carbon-nitrogen hydrolase [Atractiella rhizophila]|nr:carbon-nitrogen hydrolase [Atractiella rhizophila]